MSREAEPLESAPKIEPPRAPEAPSPAPVMAPPVTDTVFGAGMTSGMGAPTGVTFGRHLARRPAEERKSVVDDLNGRVGNRRVARMLESQPVLSRVTDEALAARAEPASARTADFARLVADRDISGIKGASNFADATETQRFEMIEILLDQRWVGPQDELAIEAIWDSFGEHGIGAAFEGHESLWSRCIDRGAELYDIPAVQGMRDRFESDVKAVARAYMRMNRRSVEQEAARLGLGNISMGVEGQIDREAIRDVQQMVREVQRADDALARLRQVPVGYEWVTYDVPAGGVATTEREVATYNPSGPPLQRPSPEEASQFGVWEEVDRHYKAVSQARAVLTARNPAVFATAEAGRGEAGRVAEMTPEAAAARLRELLSTTLANIDATEPKINSGDLDWRDLVPIHHQLHHGLPSESGVRWDSALAQGVARDVIGDYQSTQFWITLGLGTLAAAAFIFSEIATAGMATFLWAAAGVGASAAQAGMSWERYEDLSTAAGAASSGDTRLVTGEQVSEAAIAAVMDTAFAFLDGISAVRGVASAARAVAARNALGRLGQLAGAEAREVVERAVRELGPQETIRRSGRTADELAEIVGRESEAGTALRNAADDIAVASPLEPIPEGASAAGAPVTEAGRRIAARAQGVFERWARLTPEQRLNELLEQVNEEMRRLGAPPLDAIPLTPSAGNRGKLNFANWELGVNEDLFSRATISEADFAQLVGTVTHEGRHAEQWFRMAQVEAMAGQTAPDIARKLGIDPDVARAAVEVQNGTRPGARLAGGAAEAEARALHDAVYGAGRANRRQTFRDLRAAKTELEEATRELAAVKSRPVGDPGRVAAEARFRSARAARQRSYAAYRALPEEADAFRVGDAANAAMRERFDMLGRIQAARQAERQAFARYEPLEDLWMSVVGRPNHHLTYDKLLEFHQAIEGWQRAIYAVDDLERQLERLGTSAVGP